MILTIDLTPEEMAAVEFMATKRGMDMSAFAKQRILEQGEDYGSLFPDIGAPEEEEASERAWQASFARTGPMLDRMAAQARENRRQGRTVEFP